MGVGMPHGASIMLHLIWLLLEAPVAPNFPAQDRRAVVGVDVKNAFQELTRDCIFATICNQVGEYVTYLFKHVLPFLSTFYNTVGLLTYIAQAGAVFIDSEEGTHQGNVWSPALFAASIHPSVCLHGLEEGMAYHDICAAACAADVLLSTGAYGTRRTDLPGFSLLAAARIYRAPTTPPPTTRDQMVDIADTYLAEHDAREQTFAANLRQHEALALAQATNSMEISASSASAPEGVAAEPPPIPTREFPLPIPLFAAADELEAVMTPIQTAHPRWNRTPPGPSNPAVGYPTVVRFTPPQGGDPNRLVPPLSPPESSINRVLEETVLVIGTPLTIWPLRTAQRLPTRQDSPRDAPPLHNPPSPACGLLVQWESERLQLAAIAVSALPTLHTPGTNMLAHHHIPPRPLILPDLQGPLPEYHPALLLNTVDTTGGRFPPIIVTSTDGTPLPLHMFLNSTLSDQNHQAWRDWIPHHHQSTSSSSCLDDDRASKRPAHWYANAPATLLCLFLLFACVPVDSSQPLPACIHSPTRWSQAPPCTGGLNSCLSFTLCRDLQGDSLHQPHLGALGTDFPCSHPLVLCPTIQSPASQPLVNLRPSVPPLLLRGGPWGADSSLSTNGGILINVATHNLPGILAASFCIYLVEALLLLTTPLRAAMVPSLAFLLIRGPVTAAVGLLLLRAVLAQPSNSFAHD
jgi:hypothetical protein